MPIKNNLDADLRTLGWSQAELARRLGVHRNTVSKWAIDQVVLPGPVRAYLKLATKAKEMLE